MNPYAVLGVNESASYEEIRRAYLDLVKKYHPDKYTDTDLKDLANEKLKEVNEAYDVLTKNRNRGAEANSSYTRSAYSGPRAEDFSRARSFINQGNLYEAQRLLDSITDHNAEWHYLYGLIYFRQGMHDRAAQYFGTACRMNPENIEYSNAYSAVYKMSGRGGYDGGGSDGCSTCDICGGLLCADCCCEMMGGDLIPCC